MQNFKSPLDLAESLGKVEEVEENKENVGEPKEWNTIVDELIADEQEAIDGYNEAIEFVNSQADKNEEHLKVLQEIKAEEEEHIVKLNALKKTTDPTA